MYYLPMEPQPDTLTAKATRDLAVGTLWLVVLGMVARAGESSPVHGYELARQLGASAPAGLAFRQGTLYPVLRSMEADGLLTSVLVPSTEGPARKVFSITARGQQVLRAWTATWISAREWVDGVLGAGAPVAQTVSNKEQGHAA
jgi:PadR family transcriptional regulator PadR